MAYYKDNLGISGLQSELHEVSAHSLEGKNIKKSAQRRVASAKQSIAENLRKTVLSRKSMDNVKRKLKRKRGVSNTKIKYTPLQKKGRKSSHFKYNVLDD